MAEIVRITEEFNMYAHCEPGHEHEVTCYYASGKSKTYTAPLPKTVQKFMETHSYTTTDYGKQIFRHYR